MAWVEGSEAVAACYVRRSNELRNIGFASFDSNLLKFAICEFEDEEHFALFESVLLQSRASQVVVAWTGGDADRQKLLALCDSCGVQTAGVKGISQILSGIKSGELEQDMERLLKDTVKNHLPEFKMEFGCIALASLISHFTLMNDPSNFRKCSLTVHESKSYMQMDRAAHLSLGLFPLSGESMRKNTSLLGLLNLCQSSIGTRKLHSWVACPLTDPTKIEKRHDIVEALVNDDALRRCVHTEHMRKVPDLDKLISRMHKLASASIGSEESAAVSVRATLSLQDMVKLYDCIVESHGLYVVLSQYQGMHRETVNGMLTEPMSEVLSSLDTFLKLVEHSIDMHEAAERNYVINRSLDSNLQNLADELDDILRTMEAHRHEMHTSLGLGAPARRKSTGSPGKKDEGPHSLKVVELSGWGRVFRVTRKDMPRVQERKGEVKQVRINKDSYLFTTSKMQSLASAHETKQRSYEKCQAHLKAKALAVAATYVPVFEKLGVILATLDILTAFARAAIGGKRQYVRPQFDPNGETLELKQCRHPLVEDQSTTLEFIPNDTLMRRSDRRVHIVTGPNMGGKSTYIRQVALIAVMAQIGSFVPCNSAMLPIFNEVFCRVGAADSQMRGISTFLAEMIEASAILRRATPGSLVVIDELGRGTSTCEGFGLAWAIAKYLAEDAKCFSLFATHFHEMAALQEEVPGVCNTHATAVLHGQKPVFLYKVQDGFADQSFGAHVAKMVSLPASVVKAAELKSEELEMIEQHELFHQVSHFMSGRRKRKGAGVMQDVEEADRRGVAWARLRSLVAELKSQQTETDFVDSCRNAGPVLLQLLAQTTHASKEADLSLTF